MDGYDSVSWTRAPQCNRVYDWIGHETIPLADSTSSELPSCTIKLDSWMLARKYEWPETIICVVTAANASHRYQRWTSFCLAFTAMLFKITPQGLTPHFVYHHDSPGNQLESYDEQTLHLGSDCAFAALPGKRYSFRKMLGTYCETT